jgi:hypothetical protein
LDSKSRVLSRKKSSSYDLITLLDNRLQRIIINV